MSEPLANPFAHLRRRLRPGGIARRLGGLAVSLGRDARGFAVPPEPFTMGRVARGRQIGSGRFLFRGYLIEAPGTSIWDLPMPDAAFEADLHEFGWLDDLAAAADPVSAAMARDWTFQWIERFGKGAGPGWAPELTGHRIVRWIAHADTLLQDVETPQSRKLLGSLSRQVRQLRRRWRTAPPGLPRIAALAGLVRAGRSLEGMSVIADRALTALDAECAEQIDPEGGIASRNPEELSEIFALLSGIAATCGGEGAPPAIVRALSAMAPMLRTLRHADGSLARFHGGGRGVPGRLDHALAASGQRPGPPVDRAMGFARLAHGRTSLIMDAASPPQGPLSGNAHASALAFELTSGRRPLIVSCGSGAIFGPKWRRVGRATPSHSTLAIEGMSSARFGQPVQRHGRSVELLAEFPGDVRIERRRNDHSTGLIAGHDGYVATHGLTHVRQLFLGNDGRELEGEDVLATVEREDEAIFDSAMDNVGWQGIAFSLRFHLHPEVTATLDGSGATVSLMPKSGELWLFTHRGAATLSVAPSVYLDTERLAPRPTRQIVLKSTAVDYATRISWSLAKAGHTPDGLRDIVHDDQPVMV